MNVLNRKQFRELWNSYKPNLGDWDSPLWNPDYATGKKSRYFVMIRPIPSKNENEFKIWVHKYCRGQILCYSIDDENQEAWYGFSHKPDVFWFVMRWS